MPLCTTAHASKDEYALRMMSTHGMSQHITGCLLVLVVNVLQHVPCSGRTQRPRSATIPKPAIRYGTIRMHASMLQYRYGCHHSQQKV